MLAAASAAVAACGGGGAEGGLPAPAPPATGGGGAPPPPPPPPSPAPTTPVSSKSAKRGIAYDLISEADYAALAPGVSWWYDWSAHAHGGDSAALRARHGMGFVPMLWNDNFDDAQIRQLLLADPQIRHLLVLNEPNLVDQANLSPAAAAAVWPRFEALATATGVQIVGPQITWGTMPGYQDPVVWLDAFHTAYRNAHGGRDPRIDCLGFHWYDYGLGAQLDRLSKYHKPFWVTEFANWHVGDGTAQIDTAAKQLAQMQELVAVCEARSDVQRYAWFTGRWQPDPHFTSLLQAPGELSALGRAYLALPAGSA